MFCKVATVQQPDLREENSRYEGHLRELLQTRLHLKLVPLLLGHEGHGANIGPGRPAAARHLCHHNTSTALHFTSLHNA